MKTKRTIGALMLALVMVLSLGLTACGSETVKFTVTFESNGGSAVAALTVEDGGKIAEPTAPAKADHDFAGWYKDAAFATEWKFDVDTVTADTTLYAKWTPYEQFAVTFETGDGSAVSGLTVTKGHTITKPTDPTLAKHRFDGWFKEEACTNAWNFDTDKVTAAVTLYAKWTRVEAGTIAWVTPEAGSVVVPSDYGLYNPDYRLTLEDFAPDVYATEDGERLPTIIAAADETFAYDETTRLLTPGNYTVTYEALDSVNGTHEETFDVVVKDAEEINYYVYAKQDKSGKNFGTAVGGARVRVAHDRYFEITDPDNLPEGIKNPHAQGKIADYPDPYIIKNATQSVVTLATSDAMAEYTVFEKSGKVAFGWNGANGRGIDENNPFAPGKNGGISGINITVPAGGYVLIVGYTEGGNWYGKTTRYTPEGKTGAGWYANAADSENGLGYWGAGKDVPQYDMDGRQFASMSFNYRLGNMVQLKKGVTLLTDEYANQLPYILKGYDALTVFPNTTLTDAVLKEDVEFWDDQTTFAADALLKWDTITIDYSQANTAVEGTYSATYTVKDTQSDRTYEFVREIVVAMPTKYVGYEINGVQKFAEIGAILENSAAAPSGDALKSVTLLKYTNRMAITESNAKLANIQYSAAVVYDAQGKVKAFVDPNGGFYKTKTKEAGTYATNQLQCFKLNAEDTNAIAGAYELQDGDVLYAAYHVPSTTNALRSFLFNLTKDILAKAGDTLADKSITLNIVGME